MSLAENVLSELDPVYAYALMDTLNDAGVSSETLKTIAGTVLIATGLFKSITTVSTGEMGVRTRWGKVRTDKEGFPILEPPGWHIALVGFESIEKVETMDRVSNLSSFNIGLNEDGVKVQHKIDASALWRVYDFGKGPSDAQFNIKDLSESIVGPVSSAVREVCLGQTPETLTNEYISQGANEVCGDLLTDKGVELRGIFVTDLAPTDAEVSGRKQVEAAEAIADGIRDAAKILVNGFITGQTQ